MRLSKNKVLFLGVHLVHLLSKGYDLTNRFSEDINLAIDRAYFDIEGNLSRSQIKKLRKKAPGL